MMEDRRTQRTRAMLEQALLQLIEERGYENITVQEITDRANIGRATFYLHYQDKEHLLLRTVQRLLTDLTQRLQPLAPDDVLGREQALNSTIFAHIAAHHHLYRVLLSEHGAAFARHQLEEYVTQQAQHFVITPLLQDGRMTAVPIDFLASYLSGTLFAAISWWLDHQGQYTPEEMGQLVGDLARPGLLAALGSPRIDPF